MVSSAPLSAYMPRVAAVFISYNCSEELPRNIEVLSPQVGWTFVIDNGSLPGSAGTLQRVKVMSRVTLICLPANVGIAAALNMAMREIDAAGYTWAVTMDQDSMPDASLVADLLTAAKAADQPVAVVAPLIFGAKDNSLIQGWLPAAINEKINITHQTVVCMTSGSLTNVEVWKIVNGFDESLFIDYVDNEYCIRCSENGFYTWQSFAARIYHHLGSRRFHRIFRWRFSATHHSAWRRYFITRNRLYVSIKFWRSQRSYVLNDLKNMVVELIKIVLVEDHKLAKILSIVRGLKDGIVKSTR